MSNAEVITIDFDDMSQFEAEFPRGIVKGGDPTLEALPTVLDESGHTYPDFGQRHIATACGTGKSNGVDLDGE